MRKPNSAEHLRQVVLLQSSEKHNKRLIHEAHAGQRPGVEAESIPHGSIRQSLAPELWEELAQRMDSEKLVMREEELALVNVDALDIDTERMPRTKTFLIRVDQVPFVSIIS